MSDQIQRGPNAQRYHLEVSTHGIMFFEEIVEVAGSIDNIPFLHFVHLVTPLGRALDTAASFFDGALTNLLIRCEIFHVHDVAYLETDPRQMIRPQKVAAGRRCLDEGVRVSTNTTAEALAARRDEIIADIIEPMLWAFNYRTPTLRQYVLQSVRGRQFV